MTHVSEPSYVPDSFLKDVTFHLHTLEQLHIFHKYWPGSMFPLGLAALGWVVLTGLCMALVEVGRQDISGR